MQLVTMFDGEDMLFRPVVRGLLKAESLIDGSVDLDYVVMLNEALDVDGENRYRVEEASRRGR